MRLKIPDFLIIVLFFGFTCQSQTIIPGGYVSGTWDEAGSPYHIMDTVIVHKDSLLVIEKGVWIEFFDTSSLIIHGNFIANGEEEEYIDFILSNLSTEFHITENQFATDTISFKYCTFQGGSNIGEENDYGGIVYVDSRSKVRFNNCWFTNSVAKKKGGAMYLNNSGIEIKNSYFFANQVLDTAFTKGGAIYMNNSNPTLIGNDFRINMSINGGAIYCARSSPIIYDCFFHGSNAEGGGGAIVFHDSGHVLLENCEFVSNSADGSGGAIAILEGITAQIIDCVFKYNYVESEDFLADGGAIFITPYDNEVNILNCEFKGNDAEDYGGAIYTGSNTRVISSLLYSNSASGINGGGGAVTTVQNEMLLLNCTFHSNEASSGTSIFCEDADLTMINSILWDDMVQSQPKIFLSTFETPPALFVDHSNIEGGLNSISGTGAYVVKWAGGNLDADPHFMLPGTHFTLAWNSPCINAGRSDTLQLLIPIEDLAGNPRLSGGEIDMGCYEYQGPISIPEKVKNEDFVVYPNPAKDHIYIKSGHEFDGRLTISDLSGRKVVDREVNISQDSPIRQAIFGLPSGFYMLVLVSNELIFSQKLIIK